MQSELRTEAQIINELIAKGYTHNFNLEENNLLKCLENNETFTKVEVRIVEHYRTEGESDPDYMSVVYAIEAGKNTKGIIVDAFGTYSNRHLSEFMQEVEKRPQSGVEADNKTGNQ